MANGEYNWKTANMEGNRNNSSISPGNENLPRFSDTFLSSEGSDKPSSNYSFTSNSCSNSWGASTSGRQYETTTNVDLEKRFDWDGLVDKVFSDEKRKTIESAVKN
eukprot:GFUD01065094.1.p1 GENE.GFUD01065094.1~~GFUD01065094.1.p1  ORF type:complete len:106 (-),score=23.04 GFUD01065094.1:57-374(-)